jgi:hypothetical protein
VGPARAGSAGLPTETLVTMQRYDPNQAPPPGEWLALDEDQRIELVARWHRKKKIRLPNVRAHATFHVIVENQLAENDQVPCQTLARLMREGLDRHDSIHAIGSVLAEHMHALLSGERRPGEASNAIYYDDLRRLTAKSWLQSG